MSTRFKAVMSNGCLKPVEAITLAEGQPVSCEVATETDRNLFDDRSLEAMAMSRILAREFIGAALHGMFHSLTGAQASLAMAERECRENRRLRTYIQDALSDIRAAYETGKSVMAENREPRRVVSLLPDVIATAISGLQGPIRRRKADVRIDSNSFMNVPPLVANSSALTHLSTTLILRAIESAPADGQSIRIEISADCTQDSVVIRFRDWGGQPVEFSANQRPEVDSRDYNSWIGILVATDIARAHGGTLTLAHQHLPTEFVLSIPLDRGGVKDK